MKVSPTVWLVPLLATGMFAASEDEAAPDTVVKLDMGAAELVPMPPECIRRLPEDFTPMTRTQRAGRYASQLIGPGALIFSAVRTGFNEARGVPTEWGRNGRGLGYRMADGLANHAINVTFESGIALWRDEDNRYFSSGEHGFGRRMKYVVASAFLARHSNGSRSLSYSGIAGPLIGSFLSRTWKPPSANQPTDALSSFGVSIGIRIGLHTAREFAPGFVKRFIP